MRGNRLLKPGCDLPVIAGELAELCGLAPGDEASRVLRPLLCSIVLSGAALAGAQPCFGQQQQAIVAASTTVTVLGDVAAVDPEDAARSVVVLDTQKTELLFPTSEDYLRTDASVDIQQRGAAGVMDDVSVRGASFEQTLVLVNGLRLNNAETSHFNLDLPLPKDAVGSMQILHGAGSTLYGSDAIGGVVDVLTAKPDADVLRLRAGGGSFGENQEALLGSVARGKWRETVAGDRDFSTGFIEGRDYRTENASAETWVDTALGETDVLLAGDDRAFGANQFYGPYDSWERTKGWFVSGTQRLSPSTQAAVAYRRHSDIFLLERTQPAGYKNQHIDSGFEGAVRDQRQVFHRVNLIDGLEEDTDGIRSTNLGHHGRNRTAGYAAAEVRMAAHASLSAGVRAEVFDGGHTVFSPMSSATLWLKGKVMLHGAVGHGFRLPTYLDLYYSDPSTRGNPHLQPESAWNYEAGANWYPGTRFSLTSTAFYSSQQNTIDYTRASAAEPWQASNLARMHFAGVETAADWHVATGQDARLSWTMLEGAQSALAGLQSEYVFNYPVHNARLEWVSRWKDLQFSARLGVVQRYQKRPYAVLDVAAAYEGKRLRPYLQLTNLTNTGYEEISGVRMPSRGVVAGMEFALAKKAR